MVLSDSSSPEQKSNHHERKHSKPLTGTIEKIISDKVVSEVVSEFGRNGDVDYHNWFSEANESQGRRQRFCGNEATAVSVEKE